MRFTHACWIGCNGSSNRRVRCWSWATRIYAMQGGCSPLIRRVQWPCSTGHGQQSLSARKLQTSCGRPQARLVTKNRIGQTGFGADLLPMRRALFSMQSPPDAISREVQSDCCFKWPQTLISFHFGRGALISCGQTACCTGQSIGPICSGSTTDAPSRTHYLVSHHLGLTVSQRFAAWRPI